MNNRIIDNSDELSHISYEIVLNKILKNIDNIKILNNNGNIYITNLHEISKNISDSIIKSKSKISNILQLETNKKISTISINHKDEMSFIKNINHINKKIQSTLESKKIEKDEFQKLDIYNKSNLNTKVNFGLDYDFTSFNLKRSKISTNRKKDSERLRVDSVSISIETENLRNKLISNLKKYIDTYPNIDDDIKEDLYYELEKSDEYEIGKIINILDSEVLARIKRTVSYFYLEYLGKNTENIFLKDYIRRFKLLEEFLFGLSQKSQNKSELLGIDIANLFLKGDAFRELPIIGVVEGNIVDGNYEDNGIDKKISKFALKLKLNGKVNKDGTEDSYKNKNSKECYFYYLDMLLDNETKLYKKLKIFFLYIFMFRNLGDLEHNPVLDFENIKEFIEDKSKQGTENDRFDKLCKALKERLSQKSKNNKLDTYEKINSIKCDLEKIIKYKESSLKSKNDNYAFTLLLNKNIIDNSALENISIFKSVKHNIEYLKYVSISNKDFNESDVLLSTAVEIKIESYSLYETDESKETKIYYDIENIKSVPIVMYPDSIYSNRHKMYMDKFREIKNKTINNNKCIYIATLQDEDVVECDVKYYLYRLIYTTISYILIKNILALIHVENKKDLFIPIIRYHDKGERKKVSRCDKYIREYSKILEHILSNEYRSSSQGFDISANPNYNYKNAVSSLYSKIPRCFREKDIGNIDKMAMIILTSRKCDNSTTSNESISTLFGDVVLFDKLDDKVKCDLYSTFNENYTDRDLYKNPKILKSIVNFLYEKGYKNILYIAKAPYTSTLNITKKDDLFFMDEHVLDLMIKNKNDLFVYPLYYNNFYAIDYKQNAKTDALYIEDTNELDKMINQVSKSTASVFNLYSGKTVGNKWSDKRYRSVILYQTLYNLYNDKILNTKINEGLIANSITKNSIMNFITMYHYTRYESSNNISIKINPYSKLMGDDGISGMSVRDFEMSNFLKFKFNMLAYLSEIKQIMDGDI